MSTPFKVQILNKISAVGLAELPDDLYEHGDQFEQPDAIMVRSADMHEREIPGSVKAIARAGAGTNNIPVEQMSERGVPVFNAPGANANAVKELVLSAMLLSARNLPAALRFVSDLDPADPGMAKAVESGKKAFAGFELAGRTIGVVGLGRIGCLVADAAINLGMQVIGYDPDITVEAAWSLPSQVKKSHAIDDLLGRCDFISLHIPLIEATRKLINADSLGQMRRNAVLMNFSRAGIVDEAAVAEALDAGRVARYVCDFPSAQTHGLDNVIALPHLGASTREAEDNCATMVAHQLREYLENGNITNSVNFPNVSMPRESDYRLAISNANMPNMVGQISTQMANASLNIHNMINKSRGQVAYTVLDIDSPARSEVIAALASIDGVLTVRYLPAIP